MKALWLMLKTGLLVAFVIFITPTMVTALENNNLAVVMGVFGLTFGLMLLLKLPLFHRRSNSSEAIHPSEPSALKLPVNSNKKQRHKNLYEVISLSIMVVGLLILPEALEYFGLGHYNRYLILGSLVLLLVTLAVARYTRPPDDPENQ